QHEYVAIPGLVARHDPVRGWLPKRDFAWKALSVPSCIARLDLVRLAEELVGDGLARSIVDPELISAIVRPAEHLHRDVALLPGRLGDSNADVHDMLVEQIFAVTRRIEPALDRVACELACFKASGVQVRVQVLRNEARRIAGGLGPVRRLTAGRSVRELRRRREEPRSPPRRGPQFRFGHDLSETMLLAGSIRHLDYGDFDLREIWRHRRCSSSAVRKFA